MTRASLDRSQALRLAAAALAFAVLFGLVNAQDKEAKKPAATANKYIGAAKCKNCHSAAESGNQYAAWQATHHSKAFETLATDEAKRIAKEKGIDDPQKSDACLRCHVTAFGLPEDQIKKGFDPKLGVQCETCHGPGDNHVKARMAAVAKAAGAGEIPKGPQPIDESEMSSKIGMETCLGCHNEQSPTFKPFCFCERAATIRHLDPRKTHAPGAIQECACEDPCPCVHGDRPDGKPCCAPAKEVK
ncbi:MAG TPA: cytochrome c family protein [Planctomycetota bacterium]|nr:cytochrome c family protein [Planctomycetota bacterium]